MAGFARSDFETARSPARGRVSRRIGGEDGDKRERHWPPDRPFGSVVSLPTEGRDQKGGGTLHEQRVRGNPHPAAATPATTVAFSAQIAPQERFAPHGSLQSPARGRDGQPRGSIVSPTLEGRDQGWGSLPLAQCRRRDPHPLPDPGHCRGLFRSNRSTGAI